MAKSFKDRLDALERLEAAREVAPPPLSFAEWHDVTVDLFTRQVFGMRVDDDGDQLRLFVGADATYQPLIDALNMDTPSLN